MYLKSSVARMLVETTPEVVRHPASAVRNVQTWIYEYKVVEDQIPKIFIDFFNCMTFIEIILSSTRMRMFSFSNFVIYIAFNKFEFQHLIVVT